MYKTKIVNGVIVREPLNSWLSPKNINTLFETKRESARSTKKFSYSFRCGDGLNTFLIELEASINVAQHCTDISSINSILTGIIEQIETYKKERHITSDEQSLVTLVTKLVEDINNNPNLKFSVLDETERIISKEVQQKIKTISALCGITIEYNMMDTSDDFLLAQQLSKEINF
jgi:hypothetical protein